MEHFTTEVEARDGRSIPVLMWRPDATVRGAVHIVHGMAEYAGRYGRLASRLTDAGFVVWAHDQRGHGGSAGIRLHLADRGGWECAVADVHDVTAALGSAHPGVPVFLLGHSMGSSVARSATIQDSTLLSGLILSGVSGDPGILGALGSWVAAAEARMRGPRARSRLMSRLTFGRFNASVANPRTRLDWLSRDPAVVDAYLSDPLCGGVATTAFYRDLLAGVRAVSRDQRVAALRGDLPVLVLAGDADPVGDMGRGARGVADQLGRLGRTDVTLRLYPGARHEVFNEINRDVVTDDLLAWLTPRVGTSGQF